MIIYFSGTGNSRYCAEMLADELGDEIMDAFSFIKNGIAGDFRSGTPWVFVSPTYSWQIPHVFRDFIRSAYFDGSDDAYFVMTCGSDIGSAGTVNKALCAEKGFNYKGTLEVVMPENYIAMFPVPKKDKALRIIEAAKPVLKNGIRCISDKKSFPEDKGGIINNMKSGIVNKAFYPMFVKAKAFTVSDACIFCGKCVSACPMNNISLISGKPSWGSSCTHCMACICGCPASAIEYGRISRGKLRYQCPAYTPEKR